MAANTASFGKDTASSSEINKRVNEWIEYQKDPLNLSGGNTVKFKLPDTNGVLLVGQDFVAFVQMVESPDENLQQYLYWCYSKKFQINMASQEGHLYLTYVPMEKVRDDGSRYIDNVPVGDLNFINVIHAGVFIVTWTKDNCIHLSTELIPSQVVVTESTVDAYFEKLKEFRESRPAV